MKIRDAFERVKKPALDAWGRIDSEALFKELNIDSFNYDYQALNESDRLAGYRLTYWQCSDTEVGTVLYFLDNKPAAVVIKPYRKSDSVWHWVSREMRDKVRAFVEQFRNEEEVNVTLLDMDKEIEETYTIDYREQLYSDRTTALYKGNKATLLIGKEHKHYYESDNDDSVVMIRKENEELMRVSMKEIEFPMELEDKC